nr:hypothetical protein [Lachnospiraceae bacterium]
YSIVESEITGYTGTVQEATDNGDITFFITNRHTPTPPTTPPDTPDTPDTPVTPPAPAPTPEVAPTARIKPPTPVPTVDPAVLGAKRAVLGGQRAGKVLGARRASTGDDAAMVAYGVMSGGSFAGFWAWILAFLKRKKEERQRRLARAEKQS